MSVNLLTEHNLEFLSFKGGYTGSSESTLEKNATLLEITCRGSIFNYFAGAIQQLIRDVDYGEESDNILKTSNNSGCACIKYNCGCCAHIVFPKIDLNDTGTHAL